MLRKSTKEFQSYERFTDEIEQSERQVSQNGEHQINKINKETEDTDEVDVCCPPVSLFSSVSLPPNQSPPEFAPFDTPIEIVGKERSLSSENLLQQSSDVRIDPFYSATIQLHNEILNSGGVQVSLPASELLSNVAYVKIADQVWIAGWNQMSRSLHGLFHIGDMVVAIDDFPVLSVKQLQRALKVTRDMFVTQQFCTLRLRRTPLAKALIVARQFPGEDIGIIFDNGSNRVLEIKRDGPLACAGLPLTAQRFLPEPKRRTRGGPMRLLMPEKAFMMVGEESSVPWTVTEINNRPVDIFYQNHEASLLVDSHGTQIGLVFQPSDFISLLCKKLKKKKNNF